MNTAPNQDNTKSTQLAKNEKECLLLFGLTSTNFWTLKNFRPSDKWETIFSVTVMCISLIMGGVECIFIYLKDFYVSFSENCLLISFVHFSMTVFFPSFLEIFIC